ncbi:MAG: hypothetical protein ABDH32_05365 [Candidatus Caldarchaeales archaeon]
MSLLKNTLMTAILLTIVWAGFLTVTFILAYTLFPVIEYADGEPILGLIRVTLGVTVIALWVYGWYELTKRWFYRLMLKE